jgi:hypothetical protein
MKPLEVDCQMESTVSPAFQPCFSALLQPGSSRETTNSVSNKHLFVRFADECSSQTLPSEHGNQTALYPSLSPGSSSQAAGTVVSNAETLRIGNELVPKDIHRHHDAPHSKQLHLHTEQDVTTAPIASGHSNESGGQQKERSHTLHCSAPAPLSSKSVPSPLLKRDLLEDTLSLASNPQHPMDGWPSSTVEINQVRNQGFANYV